MPPSLFRAAAATIVLHLSLDGGRTLESVAPGAPGPAMLFALRPAPQLTKVLAFTTAGEPVSTSLFVGRPEVITLQLQGAHLLSAEGRRPVCRFTSDSGRVLAAPATILDDSAARCDVPPVPRSVEQGLRSPGRELALSLYLEADEAEFGMLAALPQEPAGRGRPGAVALIPEPAVVAVSVFHESWAQPGDAAAIDRLAVQQLVEEDPDAELLLTFELADLVGIEEATRHGRPLQAVIAQAAGSAALLPDLAPPGPARPGRALSVGIRADAFLGPAGPPLGTYRAGLVPLTEVTQASALQLAALVASDAPILLFVDSSLLKLEAHADTPVRLPTAPGFTNHLPVKVSAPAGGFGAGLTVATPLLGCALVSAEAAPSPARKPYYFSTYSLVVAGSWSSGAAELSIDFVFAGSAEAVVRAGLYCVKLAFNGRLGSQDCGPADLTVQVYHLPPSPFYRLEEPCNVVSELADLGGLDRNFAARVAIVDGELQYAREADGALLCSLEQQAYDFPQQLFYLELHDRPAAPWRLQAALEEATSENVTALALSATGEQPAGRVFFRSLLLEIVDEHLPPAPGRLAASGVFHPGETLHIRGLFLQNSPSGVVLRLAHLEDGSLTVVGVEVCQSRGDP